MPLTFIDHCNRVLRRLNEVEIDPNEFNSARGVQAVAKDAVRDAVAAINQHEFEWPFNAAEHTLTLSPGVSEYPWPDDLKVADWNSFQILQDAAIGNSHRTLTRISRDEWYATHRDRDMDAGSAGLSMPSLVFPSHGLSFGVTEVPDQPYRLTFRYFRNYTSLEAATDLTRIPDTFASVLLDRALVTMYMFRSNAQDASVAEEAFRVGLKNLQTLYVNEFSSITDTRVANSLGIASPLEGFNG